MPLIPGGGRKRRRAAVVFGDTTPTVSSTTEVSGISSSGAVSGGVVDSDGGPAVTSRGVCWSTSTMPTTADSKTTNGTGIGAFSSTLTGLAELTTYYVRAYATNSEGTSYGPQVSFNTVEEPSLTILHELDFANTSASASSGLVKFGLAFEKGDIPTGEIPKVRIQGGSNVRGYPIETATWSDGSMRKCTMVADVGTVVGSSTVTLEIYNETGAVAASSFNPVTWAAGLDDDCTVDITSRSGFTTGAMSDLAYSLKTASAVSTKRETQADTDLFVRYFCWEKVSGEQHLVCMNYLDIWLDTDGETVLAHEWVPVLSKHWIVDDPEGVQQQKEQSSYTATVKIGATTVDSRAALQHAYYCRWASLYSSNDNQHATPHWIDAGSTTKPTLAITYSTASRKKMARVGGYVPPLKWSDTGWVADSAYTYAPLTVNQHRAAINNVGAYNGRGQITRYDASAIALQTPTSWRNMRVCAQAGLAVHNAHYDHRVIDTEPSPRLIPQKIRKFGAQTYSGMGTEAAHAMRGSAIDNDAGSRDILFDAPTGGTGAFFGYDNDHAVPYSHFAAFITGERYLVDAAMSSASLAMCYSFMNRNGHNKSYEASSSVSSPTHGVIPTSGGVRGRAWSMNVLSYSWALFADDNPNKAYMENMLMNYDAFHAVSLPRWEQAWRDWGGWYFNQPNYYSPWMSNWTAMIYSQWLPHMADLGFGDGFRACSNQIMQLVKRAIDSDRQSALTAYVWRAPCGTYYNQAATPWIENELGIFVQTSGSWNGSDITINGPELQNGDRFVWMGVNSSNGPTAYPTETDWFQVYYIVNLTGGVLFNLALTPGGSPVTFSGSGNFTCGLDLESYDQTVSDTVYQGDSQAMQALAAITAAYMEGNQGVTIDHLNSFKTFMSTSNGANYGPWNYSEEQS